MNTVELIGTERVVKAARIIAEAAEKMIMAAAQMRDALDLHHQREQEKLFRLEELERSLLQHRDG